ncbi:hypothetical protein DFH11DRAFT_1730003 [Phellopilus nigrolimitatus]|nr:hypothetical protein DFH11DRAFT_1730003 [Phellopilus nigrolimitatus]
MGRPLFSTLIAPAEPVRAAEDEFFDSANAVYEAPLSQARSLPTTQTRASPLGSLRAADAATPTTSQSAYPSPPATTPQSAPVPPASAPPAPPAPDSLAAGGFDFMATSFDDFTSMFGREDELFSDRDFGSWFNSDLGMLDASN